MKILLHDYGGYAFSFQLAKSITEYEHFMEYVHGGSTQVVQRFNQESTYSQLLNIEGVQLSKPFDKYSYARRWWQEREYSNRLKCRLYSVKPDICISANAPLDVQRTALQTCKHLNVPFIFWWQDVISIAMQKLLEQKFGALGKLIGYYYQKLERELLRESDAVLAISDDFKKIAHSWEIPNKKIHVIPNWAPLEDIPVLPKDNHWAQTQGLQDKFVFLYAGILGLKHTPQLFVDLAQNFQHVDDVEVVVVSEGPGAKWLSKIHKSQAITNLRILPFQAYQDVPYMLASANVLIAVLNEKAGDYSVPSKVMSYLCAARPIIISAPLKNESVKLIHDCNCGYAIPPEEINQLCQVTRELYDQPRERERFSKNARTYAEKNFDIDMIAKKFLKVIECCQ